MSSHMNSEFAARLRGFGLKESGSRPAGDASLNGPRARPATDWPRVTVRPAALRPTATGPVATRPKVLVADEDALCREVLVRILGAEYNVATACSGEEVRAKVLSERPQLVVLSATLPGSLQFESLQLDSLKRETCCARCGGAERPSSPLVLMLGSGSADERADALECGVADYLEKPFGMREFAARVRVLLRPKPQLQ